MFAQDAKCRWRTLGLTFVAPCGPGKVSYKYNLNLLTNMKECVILYIQTRENDITKRRLYEKEKDLLPL